MTTLKAASLNNPDPSNWHNITYTVKGGDNLWEIAKNVALAEASANHQTLSPSELTTATAKEWLLIQDANGQIANKDLIYSGDKIAIPVQTPGATKPEPGGIGFDSPGTPYTGVGGALAPGQDILSSNGNYDLVLLGNGDLALYSLSSPNQRGQNYKGDTLVWQSDTVGEPVDHAAISGGNINLYPPSDPSNPNPKPTVIPISTIKSIDPKVSNSTAISVINGLASET